MHLLWVAALSFSLSINTIIQVEAALNVYTSPVDVLQPVNSEVIVNCIPTPKQNVRITWENNKDTIPYYPASGKITGNIYVFSNNSLYIRSLKRRNTGTYRCIASAGAERQYADVVVKVTYIQKFNGMDPVRVFVGSEAQVVCKPPLGVPAPKVSWKKNGKPINDSRISTDSWTLVINNVKNEDAGNYTCYATNMAKQRNVTAPLQVVIPGKVIVSPKRDEIKEKEKTSFNCVSKATPPLGVTWKKVEKVCSTKPCKVSEKDVVVSDRIKINDGQLIIENALPIDKGIYKCVASLNSEFVSANVTLNVVELIKVDTSVHQKVQRKDLRKKKEVKLACQFRGDGIFSVKWSKEGAATLPSSMVGNHTTLLINGLKFTDAGNYKCTAKGPFNTVTGRVTLEVYESPVFTVKPENTTGFVGDPAWIHCKGSGRPAPSVNYLRSKDSKTLRMKAPLNESRFETLPNHTLYIKELKMEDNGPYFCWLTQKHASISSDFYLNVKEPMLKSEAGTPMARTVGIAVGCAGVYILLVIGLMIYCRARRARLLKKGIITEGEDGECLKDPLVGNEYITLQNGKCLDQWQFPREELKEQVTLGRGKMGRVFKAKACHVSEECPEMIVAVKEYDGKIEEYKSDFDLEVEMFAQLNHDNVVRLIGVTTDAHPFYIITDFSELGDMKMYLSNQKHISNTARVNMAFCIASGMDYLIKHHYIHRDLAARNCIPYPDNNVKVSFLSICEDLYSEDYYLLNNIPVPLRWLSPEAIQTESYSEKSDVWSYGVSIWELFSGGKRPYADCKNESVLDGVCKDMRLTMPNSCPDAVYEVMTKCWLNDATQRPSFDELTCMLSEINVAD